MKKNKQNNFIRNKIIGIGMIILGIFLLYLAAKYQIDRTAGVMTVVTGTLIAIQKKQLF